MKKLYFICAALILAVGIYSYSAGADFEISSPNVIVLEKGQRFCIEDYVEVIGEAVSIEYSDNVNTNKEGTYYLTVRAEDDRGKSKEKKIEVTVL